MPNRYSSRRPTALTLAALLLAALPLLAQAPDPPSLPTGTPGVDVQVSDETHKAASFDNALDEIPISPV